jgi:hypothetical protein
MTPILSIFFVFHHRFHPSDPLAAARRLANYWKKRKEIFQERAYLPINLSGNGALTADDVKVLKMGYMVNLPRDLKGRTVVFIDMSKKNPETTPSSRTTLFVGQCLMENVKSRTDCYVGVYNISNPYAVGFDREVSGCENEVNCLWTCASRFNTMTD